MSEQDAFPDNKDIVTPPGNSLPLLDYLDELDPSHRLADPSVRADLIINADPFAAAMALREVHQRIGEHDEDISDRLMTLASQGVVNHTGVSPEDRADVFNYVLDAAKQSAARGNLELAGRILGGSIVAMQTFSDGNKRTARAVYMLTAHGYDGSPEDRDLLLGVIAPPEFDPTKVPIFIPYANWNVRAFLNEEHGAGDPEWNNRMRELEITWAGHKPNTETFMAMISEAIPDCQQPRMLTSAIQDEGIGPYILTKYLGVDIAELLGEVGINTDTLRELLSKLDNADVDALIKESEVMKAKFIKFLVDKTLEAAEAGDAVVGTPEERINVTGKPLMDAAYS